ncbi:MAG: sigma-70 family RNA polymerase sigma factor [Chloroflexi bacterium]|nr:sigma-70 family RNA polymerase sigma factor [Chloroflexota bacterium]
MTDQKDLELIGQVVKGDERAFLALYDRYSTYVYAVTLRILHDPMLAEEVTQDTFLKLWGRARQFLAERGALISWLLTIARRTSLDRLRLENRRLTLSTGTDPDDLWQNLIEPDTGSDESRWRSLHFAVTALSPDQRQVIELAYYQGLSQSEIAETLGWPLGTVKTRLRTAMEQLRDSWGDR